MNACTGCELLPTKAAEGKAHHASLERLASEAMEARYARIAGYPIDPNRIRASAFGALMMMEQLVEVERIVRDEKQTRLLMALAGVRD